MEASLYSRYCKALDSVPAPLAWLDVDAFQKNISWISGQSNSKRIRLGTKSLRCQWAIKEVLRSSPVFQGLLTMTVQESVWLSQNGLNDMVVAYPCAHRSELAGLAQVLHTPQQASTPKITLMADRPEHLDLYQDYAKSQGVNLRVALDLDVSSDFGFLHFGVYRSALRTAADLNALLSQRQKWPNLTFVGLLAYEAQIAGVPDRYSNPFKQWLVRRLKLRSQAQVLERRQEAVAWLRKQDIPLEFVNGGGTGSLQWTANDPSVDEVTVGSGFYAPTLFDHYNTRQLQPAAGFALRVSRHPQKDIWTCFGGGYPASGSAGADRLPQPYLPTGLELLPLEGAGEVQTPIRTQLGQELQIGDWVFFRHAKAGELCERFTSLYLINQNSGQANPSQPLTLPQVATYRGEGRT